ncbi:hypothetical protein CNEO3_200034 [Clostridium neonatale]|nr:hypothetical protein CNEO4_150034 [Clostridium neonatale]CAI3600328.1 hypothetical protein CNEO3_200034 [Clostridium neonatale]
MIFITYFPYRPIIPSKSVTVYFENFIYFMVLIILFVLLLITNPSLYFHYAILIKTFNHISPFLAFYSPIKI